MNICGACNQPYGRISCVAWSVEVGGVEHKAIPFGQDYAYSILGQPETCPDCGVAVGGNHHEICDWEECPYCHGQWISCGCQAHVEEGEQP